MKPKTKKLRLIPQIVEAAVPSKAKKAKPAPEPAKKTKKAPPKAAKASAVPKKPAKLVGKPKKKKPVAKPLSQPVVELPPEVIPPVSTSEENPDALAIIEDEEDLAIPPSAPRPADTPTVEHGRYEIKHDLNKRVDLYLRDRLPDLSRAALQKLIKAGSVKVNDRIAKSSTHLRSGDTVEVLFTRMVAPESVAEYIPLHILYEDDQFIAINKQAGLIVHPARGHWTGTLINGLLWHAHETHSTLSSGSDPWRPGIIHRLDRDTTGLILVAKTDEAHWRIAGQFERRTIKKMYIAIVHGEMELENDLIDAPLAVHAKQREKYAVRTDIGKPAQTMYHVAERFKGYTLLHLHPKTGRTHQLRVHCAHIGHPIVGDTMYGGKAITLRDILGDGRGGQQEGTPEWEKHLIDRQALHAHQLRFIHPTQFHRMILEAPLPPDMEQILSLLRKWR